MQRAPRERDADLRRVILERGERREQSARRPHVAASRVGGLPEIVGDDVGVLFEPGEPRSLAQAVVALLRSGRLTTLGSAAREKVVARWSNDRLVDRHVAIYEDLIARKKAA